MSGAANLLACAMCLAAAPAVVAQTAIDDANKWAWGENIGWLNWADAAEPAAVHASHLSGYVWGENVGWINLGDGSPVNGSAYSNQTGADAGVNLNPATGELSGLAWGENIGWINFSVADALPEGQAPRLDFDARRLRGYAWGENVGWINLDDDTRFVGLATCAGDINGDGLVTFPDLNAVLNAFGQSGENLPADVNGDGMVTFPDLNLVLNRFGQQCS